MASPFCSRCAIYRANRILHDLADKTSGKKLRGQGPVQLVAVFRTEGAPFEAPLKDRGKQGKQNFFAFWFHRGRGGGAVVRATETSAREIPPCAARRTQTVRKKRPGRSARNDTLRKAGATGPGALALLASRAEARAATAG